MIRRYGRFAQSLPQDFDTYGVSQNSVLAPSAVYNNTATTIPPTDRATTNLYKITSLYNHLANNKESGSNYFSMCQGIINPKGDAVTNIQDGATRTLGAFGYAVGTSSTQVSAPADRWGVVMRGLDTRWSSINQKGGRPKLSDYHRLYSATLATALSEKAGTDFEITTAAGDFYITGIFAMRKNTVTNWWSPMLSLKPSDNAFPNKQGKVTVYCCMGGSQMNAGDYEIIVCGFLNPPFPLSKVDLLCPALNSQGGGTTVSSFPQNFRLYGAYQVGLNAGNYFGTCWGITELAETRAAIHEDGKFNGYITSARVRFDPAINGARATFAAGDNCIRLVGVAA